jgi:RecB family endonuclease NucS
VPILITIKKINIMTKSKKGQKHNFWSQADENILIKNVEKHVLCLQRAFEVTSKEVQRSPKAVAAHWYQRTSQQCGRTLFATVSGKHVAVNRKNSKGQPMKLSLYKRVLSLLGLNY